MDGLGRYANWTIRHQKKSQGLAQMAPAWFLRDKSVSSVLIGASRPGQIIQNIKAAQNTGFTDG